MRPSTDPGGSLSGTGLRARRPSPFRLASGFQKANLPPWKPSHASRIAIDRASFMPKQIEMMQDLAYKGSRQQTRTWDACRFLPSGKGSNITHLYGKSFDLDDARLRMFGLWCPYLDLGDKIRMFGEWEVARGHLFPNGLILPADPLQ